VKRIVLVLCCIVATAAISTAQQAVLYFPQIAEGVQADGTQWGTIIAVTNPGTQVTGFTLNVVKDDGTPWTINWQQNGCSFDNPDQPSFICQLGPGQAALLITPGESGHSTTPLQTGYATIVFSSSTPTVSASAIFSEVGPAGRIAQAGVLSATPLTQQEIIALAHNSSGNFLYPPNTATTALAIVNPGTSTANITFQLLDSSGAPAAPNVTRTLAAKNHTAFFVNQLFPNTTIAGKLRIFSDVPTAATGLLFQSNGQFATFPVFPIP
jgi:hypothetical protein